MTSPGGNMRAEAYGLHSTAVYVDQVLAGLNTWWQELSAAVEGPEATLRTCPTEVGAGFFDGSGSKPGYTANTADILNFVAEAQQVLGEFSQALRQGADSLTEMEAVNADGFQSAGEGMAV